VHLNVATEITNLLNDGFFLNDAVLPNERSVVCGPYTLSLPPSDVLLQENEDFFDRRMFRIFIYINDHCHIVRATGIAFIPPSGH
jgi:hypothetical protein